ncbi:MULTISPECIES: hypothetical protein [Haloferax]|uniref:Uncharacterized protein n=1 Tax=Haloferax marinum TaxID=2666143 RepID=A0A6A8G5G9_9EURY|nr:MULTISPECIES: hypothetical protein [Haloferax]KAB1197309.1 hypothetical protein Hfx1150_07205 [Haloferax sp. CBA1150]MRW96351.1 hypothetical protein [Haloferax marinum]
MPSRRDYLASFGGGLGTLGLAGCLDAGPPTQSARETRTPTPPPEPHAFGERAILGSVGVAPQVVQVQESFHRVLNSSWGAVERVEDHWVVFVELAVDTPETASIPVDSIRLVAGDEVFVAQEAFADVPARDVYLDHLISPQLPYDPDSNRTGWVGFVVPSEYSTPDDVTLQIHYGGDVVAWTLPSASAGRLSDPLPTFELVSFDGPETTPTDGTVELKITATNDSAVAGVFRACVNTTGPTGVRRPHRRRVPLDAGAEATTTVELTTSNYTTESETTFECYLRTADVGRSLSISVVD